MLELFKKQSESNTMLIELLSLWVYCSFLNFFNLNVTYVLTYNVQCIINQQINKLHKKEGVYLFLHFRFFYVSI